MSTVAKDLLYTKKHEWVRLEGSKAYIGITDYAQEELGEIVFIELPELDETYAADDEIASLESVKAAAAMYNPLSGTVCEVNEALEDSPEMVNEDPYGTFIYQIEYSDKDELEELLQPSEYASFIDTLEE